MVFETKKINSETLGEYLAEVRDQLNLTIGDVAARCGMKQQFLSALENGDYGKLPADVYVYGFLRQLAVLYGIDNRQLIEQYKKERGIFVQLQNKNNDFRETAGQYLARIVITPRLIAVSLGLLFVAITVGYIIWQVASINKTPSLEVWQPQDHALVKQSAVTVEGKTDPGMSVTINGQSVYVDEQGHFKTQTGIGNGPKDLIFIASNKFDKSTSKTISVVGEDDVASPEVAGDATSSPLILKLRFTGNVSLTYNVDDEGDISQSYQNGSSTVISAQQKVLLSTSNAGATQLELNGKNMGPLGRSGEQLTDIPFVADTAAH